MASSSMMASATRSSASSSWTPKQNRNFEEALAMYGKDSPDCWQNIARATGKSVEEVRRHYDLLARDIRQIESDQVPLPNYRSVNASNGRRYPNNEQRLQKNLQL